MKNIIKKKLFTAKEQAEKLTGLTEDVKKTGNYTNSKQNYNKKVLSISAKILKHNDNRPRVELCYGESSLEALLDTGATISVIRRKEALNLGIHIKRDSGEIKGLSGMKTVVGSCNIKLKREDRNHEDLVKCLVVEDMDETMIFGIDDIHRLNLITFITAKKKKKRKKKTVPRTDVIMEAKMMSDDQREDLSNDLRVLSKDIQCEDLKIRKEYIKVLEENKEVFSNIDRNTNIDIEHAIELVENNKISACPKYRRTPEEHEIIKEEVQKFLAKGIIEESESKYVSPVVLVKKKDGGLRFCIDFRRINNITIPYEYPIPKIDETLDQLQGAKIFSIMDVESAYNQVNVKEVDRYKTAFYTREGIYQWRKMPFGLINAPFTFQRIMNKYFSDYIYKFVMIYLDDILIYSKDHKSHVGHLEIILKIIKKIGFKLNKKKCKLVQNRVEFLGFEIINGKVTIPLQQKMKTMDWKTPKTKKDVRAFCGFSSFFSKFIINYADKMLGLYDTLRGKKNSNFKMTDKALEDFTKMKIEIRNASDLRLPEFAKRFYLDTDASNLAIGAVLSQKDENEDLKPVICISRKLHAAEINYTVTEKECLAVVWAVKKLRIYLTREFTIRTDHQALKWLLNLKETTGRLMRWILILQEYKYEILYLPGKENVMADALSRIVLTANLDCDKQPLTPEEKAELVLKNHTECGHGGIDATYVLTLRNNRWKGMYSDISSMIKRCSICNKHTRGATNLQKIRLPLSNPLDRIGIDLVGPLPKSYDGNRYIVIATDYVTRWCEAEAIKSKTANVIAKFLVEKIFIQHGPPKEILSDQGAEFTNKLIKKVCEMMNTKKTFTSSYNPKCNGLAERTNQTLVGKLAKLVNGRWKMWDEFLPYAIYAYRISPRRSTRNSPYELLYGRTPNNFFKENKDLIILEDNELIIERLNDYRKMVIEEEKEIREKERDKVKKARNVEDFNINDLVRRRKLITARKNKLDSNFEGIYKIVKKGRNGNYEIEDLQEKTFSVNRKDIVKIEESDPIEWIISKEGRVSVDEPTLTIRIPTSTN